MTPALALALAACAPGGSPPPTGAPPPAAPSLGAPATVASPPPAAPPSRAPRPSVADAECADCHPEIAESYARTGMGRALSAWPPRAGAAADGARAAALVPSPEITHRPSGLRYRTETDPHGRVWQVEDGPEAAPPRRVAAGWVVGSGNHTVSFLGLADGRLVQLPLTWYTQRGLWDLSPGYERPGQPRLSRGVEGPCLFCHNDLTPLLPGRTDVYEAPLAEGIGCNRCHGDGAAHVEARQAGRTVAAGAKDPWIFNPRHAPAALQLDVCRVCHMQGDAVALRPGQRWDAHDPRAPLADHHVVFAVAGPAEAQFSIASHAERLAESRCATQSPEPLVCTTCHDPHRPAREAERATGCARCHGPQACAVPAGRRPQADCVRCHMRRGPTSDIPHVRFTDHRIVRRPETEPSPKPADAPAGGVETRLVSLTGPLPPGEAPRLEGLAHTHLWERLGRAVHRRPAIAALRAANPSAEVLSALGRALAAEGELAAAVEAFERAAALPDAALEPGLGLDRAEALLALGRPDEALAVLASGPSERSPEGAALLVATLLGTGRTDEAVAAGQAAVRRAPEDATLHARLGTALLKRGDASAASAAFERALALDPLQPAAAVSLAALLGEARAGAAAAALGPLARQPGHERVNVLLARLHRAAGAPALALQAVARLEAIGERGPAVFAEKALAQAASGQNAAAQRTLTAALAAHPGDAGLLAVATQLRPRGR